jgi:hypothetical protein
MRLGVVPKKISSLCPETLSNCGLISAQTLAIAPPANNLSSAAPRVPVVAVSIEPHATTAAQTFHFFTLKPQVEVGKNRRSDFVALGFLVLHSSM